MANEISNVGGKNIYQQYGEAMSRSAIVGKILKLSKLGVYEAGQDKEEIAKGTQMIVDLTRLRTGWIKWEDSKPIDRKMGIIGEYTPPMRGELGDHDKDMWEDPDKDPWQFANEAVMYDPEAQELYTYSATSKGGINALGELMKTYGDYIALHFSDRPEVYPKVSLDVGSYMHSNRQFGKILYPKFNIIEYVKPPKALLTADGGVSTAHEIEAPKKATLKVIEKPVAKSSDKKSPRKGVRF
jgi:hypothetical protein